MNKQEFVNGLRSAIRFRQHGYDNELEKYLRGLKNHFNEDAVTEIEDFLFELNEQTSDLGLGEFYEYLQTKQ